MALAWRTKRQIIYFVLFLAIVLGAAGIGTYVLLPAPSCMDGKLNQDEEQIDCGGAACAPCLTEKADDLIVLWYRFFEVRPGVYDVAAFVENINLTLGADAIPYAFELYDEFDSRIVLRRGSTYALPNKQFLIFEPNLETGIRVPQRIVFRLEPFAWQLADEQALPIIVSRTQREFDLSRPRLLAMLTNSALTAVRNVDVAVVLVDSAGNAVGVSEVHIDSIPDTGTAEAAFTWPHPFVRQPADVQFFVRRRP